MTVNSPGEISRLIFFRLLCLAPLILIFGELEPYGEFRLLIEFSNILASCRIRTPVAGMKTRCPNLARRTGQPKRINLPIILFFASIKGHIQFLRKF